MTLRGDEASLVVIDAMHDRQGGDTAFGRDRDGAVVERAEIVDRDRTIDAARAGATHERGGEGNSEKRNSHGKYFG